jgi:hypothetical protein
LAIDESVLLVDAPEDLVPVHTLYLTLSAEWGIDGSDKSIVVSVGEGVVKNMDTSVEVSFIMHSDGHPFGIDFFEGFDDLFDMCIPLTDLVDDDIDHLDVVNYDDEARNDPGFYRFANASAEDLSVIQAGGKRHSAKVEQWTARAFGEWKTCCGHSTEKNIADLSEEPDVQPFVNLLAFFFLEVRKRDGTHYIPST